MKTSDIRLSFMWCLHFLCVHYDTPPEDAARAADPPIMRREHKCGTSAAQVRHKFGTSSAQVRNRFGTSAEQVRSKCGGARAEQVRSTVRIAWPSSLVANATTRHIVVMGSIPNWATTSAKRTLRSRVQFPEPRGLATSGNVLGNGFCPAGPWLPPAQR